MAVVTTTNTPSTQQVPSNGAKIFNAIYEIGVTTGAGALAGYLFSIINPVGGAVFGATYAFTNIIANTVADKVLPNAALKVVACVASFFASVAVGIFAATTIGFPLTVLGSVGMLVAMVVTSCAIRCVTGGAGCCSQLLGGAGLALKERFC